MNLLFFFFFALAPVAWARRRVQSHTACPCHSPPALFFSALLLVLLVGCRPDLGHRESLIDRTRILAVRSDPPEAKPGERVRLSLLVASPGGAITPAASWAFCRAAKLLTENGAVTERCVRPDGELEPIGDATAIEAVLPADACSIFGPNIASQDLRPRDPDITGGYFQPVRAFISGADVTFGFPRLSCNLANAPTIVVGDFASRYRKNENPILGELTATLNNGGGSVDLANIPSGASLLLRQAWPDASAERFPVYDVGEQRLVDHRESLRVSWFVTAGTLDRERTGRGEEEPETFTETSWTAPSAPSTSHLYIVLRDARGGVSFATHDLVTR